MDDLLTRIERQLQTKIDELAPLVSEHDRLRDALAALGHNGETARSSTAVQAPAVKQDTRRKPHTSKGTKNAPKAAVSAEARAAAREKLSEIVGQRPGVSKEELSSATGVSNQQLAQQLRRLIASDAIEATELPGGQTGYRTRRATQQADDQSDAPAAMSDGAQAPAEAVGEESDTTVQAAVA